MNDSVFFKRQSKRSYLDQPVPADTLQRIFEMIRWSPSCANNQPWRFVFVSEQGQHNKVVNALAPGNEWAARAPVLVVVCARESDDFTRKDDPVAYYQFDCGLAVMSLLLAAVEEGLMGHPMAGYDAGKLHAALDIPSEFHVMCLISLGYQGPADLLDSKPRAQDEAPRVRKELKEIITRDRFDFAG
jgi:glutaredoxin-dependent peroxiredoxin